MNLVDVTTSKSDTTIGQYMFYALDVNTLADKPGFPIIIDGHFADNDPTRFVTSSVFSVR